jgi:uncharacterized protein YbjT (DUF2867 family)
MIAAVIGSTGLTGLALVHQLLADPAITQVISVARKSLNNPDPKLTEVLIPDLAEVQANASKMRGHVYFCCLGTTIKVAGSKGNFEKVDHTAIVDFAKMAKTYNARSFTLVSATGANANSMFFYNRVKGRTEKEVGALQLRSVILFRPALLVGQREGVRFAESLATKTLLPLAQLLPARSRKALITRVETLAGRMIAEGKAAPRGVHVIKAKDI